MRTVAEEEARAKNVIIFGLSETSSQDGTVTVNELLSELGEKPKTDVSRIGEKRDGVVRPT